mmetsp:Transcript_62128/g.148180  ORF Transcript_62128/g.148180 Transcript_62128/m.148180 type:complete len:361 (+) Transcript_62128:249-1331(+)|eukprot:CAMPEP_0178417306 /NCGR_PEP_ID=MMETSP0689_2-20121128/24506_1 /TAXON_ID=160604 /ORGANISM="Amphidinium massartii, Strain CS-259" /LENGTH=360 /DNA_ID=CAMNT_0020038667 /DNA_START=130 /DNA_END=1212 /DNA_ORIENTATION=-
MARLSSEVVVAILSYVTCSSLALVANKVVMFYLHMPGLVFCLQLSVTVAFVWFFAWLSFIEADALSYHNLRLFAPYMCSFTLSLYSNGRALDAANIETVIVFRACSPLFVSVLDWVYLGRELPGTKSLAALLGVVAGAIGYVLADGEFAMRGLSAYTWVSLNLAGIVFEMTYGKFLISGVTFKSPVWGATLYTNTLAILPMLMLALLTGEAGRVETANATTGCLVWLGLSCVVGVGISWSGWNCRQKVSATVYTLLGVVCKFISVTLNIMLWDKHATKYGLMALSVCLISSSMYRQAPMRQEQAEKKSSEAATPAELQQLKEATECEDDLTELTDLTSELEDRMLNCSPSMGARKSLTLN